MADRTVFLTLKGLKRRVITAVCALYGYDRELLDVDANERSITHKLAEHLQCEFPKWNVDCEYNRKGYDPKRLSLKFDSVNPDDTEAKTVYPDIIVHQRMSPKNLLIIEVKKANGRDDTKDVEKLRAFIKEPQYKYQYGLLLKLNRSGCAEAKLYQNGSCRTSWTEDIQMALKELGYGG